MLSISRTALGSARVLGARYSHNYARYIAPGRPKPKGWTKVGGPSGQPEGHGETLWIFVQKATGQVLHSFTRAMNAHQALKQIPYTAKKFKPATIRSDLWRPMVLVKFLKGQGHLGRAVYQRLREFRRRHELEWGWQAKEIYEAANATTERERGNEKRKSWGARKRKAAIINNQMANSIADLAAVLGGAGKSNPLVLMEETPEELESKKTERARAEARAEAKPNEDVAVETRADMVTEAQRTKDEEAKQGEAGQEKASVSVQEKDQLLIEDAAKPEKMLLIERCVSKNRTAEQKHEAAERRAAETAAKRLLHPVTVFWADERDVHHALSWTENVVHVNGIPKHYGDDSLTETIMDYLRAESPDKVPLALSEAVDVAEGTKDPVMTKIAELPRAKSGQRSTTAS